MVGRSHGRTFRELALAVCWKNKQVMVGDFDASLLQTALARVLAPVPLATALALLGVVSFGVGRAVRRRHRRRLLRVLLLDSDVKCAYGVPRHAGARRRELCTACSRVCHPSRGVLRL